MADSPAPTSSARPAWWALALVGVLGGLLSGAFGVGGGILMVPLLMTIAGLDQKRASATSLVAIVPTAIAGTATYAIAGTVGGGAAPFGVVGQVHWIAGLCLAAGGIVGSQIGARLLKRLPIGVLRWLFIALMVVVAVRMLLDAPVREGDIELSVLGVIGLVLTGLVVGIASGLFGIGGGVIAVPALIGFFGAGDLLAKGTSLLMMIPTAISGSSAHVRGRLVDLRSGLIVGLTATAASFGGVALAFLIPAPISGALFAALMLVAAVQLSVRAVRAHRAARR